MSGYERNISDEFIADLQEGILKPLLERVQNDNTLNIEFRGHEDSITVYHRGGVFLKIKKIPQGKKSQTSYEIEPSKEYLHNSDEGYNYDYRKEFPEGNTFHVESLEKSEKLLDYFPIIKDAMDLHFETKGNHRYERAYAQKMVGINNFHDVLGSKANNTDYYMIDFEPRLSLASESSSREENNNKNDQPDLLGIKWPNTCRGKNDDLTLTIFELKFGKLNSGSSQAPSDLKSHFEKVYNLVESEHFNLKDYCREAKDIFNNKRKLGLIDCNKDIGSINSDKVDYAVCLFDYNLNKSKLRNNIKKLKDQYENMNTDKISLKIVRSNLMGAALKKYNVMSPEKALKSISI